MFDSYVSYWARQTPDALAITTLRSDVTYRQFDADIDRLAHALAAAALPAGGLVGVRITNPYAHWLVLLALARIGLPSVSLPGPGERFPVLLALLRPAAMLADREELRADLPGPVVSPAWLEPLLRAPSRPYPSAPRSPEAMGRVATSSGSTGQPKPVAYSWAEVVQRCQRRALLGIGRFDTVLTPLGVEANVGFGHRLAGWMVGATVALEPGQAQLAAALPSLRPTYMVLAPGQLDGLLRSLPPDARPLPGLRLLVAGGALPPPLAREARLRLAAEVQVTYSSTEAGPAACGSALLLERHPGSVGHVLPWAQVEVVDEQGVSCPSGTQGEVRVRAEGMATEYRTGEEPDVRPRRDSFRDGWFHPGDVGVMEADGCLRIEGRVDDVMNLGGHKLLPGVVEAVLAGCPGVGEVAVFAVPMPDGTEAPWAAIVRDGVVDEAAMAAVVRERLPRLPPVHVAWLAEIPRGPTGKVLRRVLRERATEVARAA